MAGIDASIPLGYQQPDAMKTISSMVGLRSAMQGQQLQRQEIQASAMANQQSQIDLQETQAAQQIMKNVAQYQSADGNIDYNKLLPDMMQAAPKNGAKFVQNVMAMQQQATQAKQSWLTASDEQRSQFGKIMTSLVGQPPEVVLKTTDALKSSPAFASMTPSIDHFVQTGIAPAAQSGNQKSVDEVLYRIGKMAETPAAQQGMNTPTGIERNDNTTTEAVNTKPGVPGIGVGDVIPNTRRTIQLPPTQPTIGADGQPGVIGPRDPADFSGVQGPQRAQILNDIAATHPDASVRAQAKQELSGKRGGFTPTALPPGQAGNIESNFQEMNRHFAGLNDSSTGAPLAESLRGNIKALASKAITGTEGDKLAYVNGLLAHLPGFTGAPSTDLKTATDLLEKNLTQLNLSTPAATDAARSLVSAARPNSHMTIEAITDASDQVASQVQANMAMRNALSGYKMMGDVPGYTGARQRLEAIADPRIWQFMNLGSKEEKAKFMTNLQPKDRAELMDKARKLEAMGLIK